MNYKVICEASDNKYYSVRPSDIRAGQPGSLLSTFGKSEIELAAERLILFFQSYGCWVSFTLEELQLFYERNGWKFKEPLFGLLGEWFDYAMPFPCKREVSEDFVVCDDKGNYCITDLFIKRCLSAQDPTAFLEMLNKVEGVISEHLGLDKPSRPN